jgi:hypothetical protein
MLILIFVIIGKRPPAGKFCKHTKNDANTRSLRRKFFKLVAEALPDSYSLQHETT